MAVPSYMQTGGSGDETALTATQPQASRVLPKQRNIRIVRDGGLRWLEVDLQADMLWARLREFWGHMGLTLKRDEPQLGIMETEWAENRADIPEGFIRGLISKVFKGAYSAPTRDKYRMRIEPLDAGISALYLTHYGVEQVNVEAGELEKTVWKPRPSDTELSNEMLNQLLVYLGVPEEQRRSLAAKQVTVSPRASLIEEGDEVTAVAIDEGFARAWRRTGIVLDRLGLVVEDRNRSAGIYYIAVTDLAEEAGGGEKGWFASLFSGDEDEEMSKRYRIVLTVRGEKTEAHLQNVDGGAADAKARRELLTKLRDGLL
jgi:outer membrane protein assembly factor BamC